MTDDRKEIVEVLLANRLYIYSLLHKVFGAEPGSELLEQLTADTAGAAFALLSSEEGDLLAGAGEYFKGIRDGMADPNFLEKIKDEYTRLFIGPAKLVAPPWESVYRGKESSLFQPSTLLVRSTYKRYGMIPQGYPRVADDSLALEIAFMAELADRAVKAFTEGDDAELKKNLSGSADFLKVHLLYWIPKFNNCMKDAASNHLYPHMSLVLESFIRQDYEVLGEILSLINE